MLSRSSSRSAAISGLDVLALNSPASSAYTCTGTTEDAIEVTVTAGASTLSFDPDLGAIRVRLEDGQGVGRDLSQAERNAEGRYAAPSSFQVLEVML